MKIDLSDAYLQFELDDESKQYVVINTHKGLFKCNRLPCGVSFAVALFQSIIERVIQGLPGVFAYLDDILVIGHNKKEHDDNLTCFYLNVSESTAFVSNNLNLLWLSRN